MAPRRPSREPPQVLASNFISDPCFFFPCFYTFREVMISGEIGPRQVEKALTSYSHNYLDDWLNSWTIWFPGCPSGVLGARRGEAR